MEEKYHIHILMTNEVRSIKIDNITLDEAVSIAIVFFDKFATKIGDCVTVTKELSPSEYKVERMIVLDANLKPQIIVE